MLALEEASAEVLLIPRLEAVALTSSQVQPVLSTCDGPQDTAVNLGKGRSHLRVPEGAELSRCYSRLGLWSSEANLDSSLI